jgi:drug/metabolite transporter (DMT)-like permease
MASPPAGQASVTAVVLLAAVLHAAWNALLKGAGDRLAVLAVLSGTGVVLCAAAVPLLPPPAPASRGFLAVSAALHVGYEVFLLQSYRFGDLSQVYPVARGTAPLLVAGVAALVVGERLGPLQLSGVLVVSAGLALLVGSGGPTPDRRTALGFALATGVCIAAYTVADGLGVRRSGSALGYTAWLMLLLSLPIPLYAVASRGRRLLAGLRGQLAAGAAAGVLSLAAYALVLWAQTRGALAVVAALRETSVLVAALLGTVFLGERFGPRRILAAALVAAGIALLNLSG